MANDKIARKEDEKNGTVVEDVCETVGEMGGNLVGLVAGTVGGAIKLAKSKNWNEAKTTFNNIADKCENEGGKVGRKHVPGVVFSVLAGIALAGRKGKK
jgi:hypothetical protein